MPSATSSGHETRENRKKGNDALRRSLFASGGIFPLDKAGIPAIIGIVSDRLELSTCLFSERGSGHDPAGTADPGLDPGESPHLPAGAGGEGGHHPLLRGGPHLESCQEGLHPGQGLRPLPGPGALCGGHRRGEHRPHGPQPGSPGDGGLQPGLHQHVGGRRHPQHLRECLPPGGQRQDDLRHRGRYLRREDPPGVRGRRHRRLPLPDPGGGKLLHLPLHPQCQRRDGPGHVGYAGAAEAQRGLFEEAPLPAPGRRGHRHGRRPPPGGAGLRPGELRRGDPHLRGPRQHRLRPEVHRRPPRLPHLKAQPPGDGGHGGPEDPE